MKTMKNLLLAACVAATLAPAISSAQSTTNQANWASSSGAVWKSTDGKCWRASYWTPSMAIEECDPDLFKKAEVPAPVVAAAPPAPVVVVPAPVPVMPTKISFSADALFDFDKSTLRPTGKDMLDGFVRDLSNVQYDSILLTGHADRIGNASYNQKLSERRAMSVKAHLESKGIPADRITAQGMGETQPVTKAEDCKGPKTKALIACLQPDRRVDVEMTGTKQP